MAGLARDRILWWLTVASVVLACGRTEAGGGDELDPFGGADANGGVHSPHGGKPGVGYAGAADQGGADSGSGGFTVSGGEPNTAGGVGNGPGGARDSSQISDAGASPSGGAVEGGYGAQGGSGTGNESGAPWEAGGAGTADDCSLDHAVLVPITDRRDMVIDERRCKVYVSTTSGVIYTYDVKQASLTKLLELGTPLFGMDLSPRRSVLVVADGNASPYAQDLRNYVHVINLETKRDKKYYFPLQSLEAGTFMPLFINSERFLLTSNFAGSGWVPLRSVSVADGSFEELRQVDQETMLALSADGSTVAMAEPDSSGGPVDRFSLADNSSKTTNADSFVYEIGISRTGSQIAVPVYDGLFIYDFGDDFGTPTNIGAYTSHYALGVVYSPTSDVLYVAFNDISSGANSIEAIDSESLQLLDTIDANPGLQHGGNWPLVSGHMRIARNGRILAVTVNGGVKLYPLGG